MISDGHATHGPLDGIRVNFEHLEAVERDEVGGQSVDLIVREGQNLQLAELSRHVWELCEPILGQVQDLQSGHLGELEGGELASLHRSSSSAGDDTHSMWEGAEVVALEIEVSQS
jgi:hypothetical protein